jgi:hypothetical protein
VTTETVYRKVIVPELRRSAEVMDRHGLNLRVVGVVLILAAVLGLLLSLLVRGGLLNQRRLTRPARPSTHTTRA